MYIFRLKLFLCALKEKLLLHNFMKEKLCYIAAQRTFSNIISTQKKRFSHHYLELYS